MHGLFVLFCIFTFAACGKKIDEKDSVNDFGPLKEKYKTYEALAAEKFAAKDGFISDGCDSLLFTGLYYATGADVKIEKAKDPEGKWHRRDLSLPPCYPTESSSEISRDMYIGLLWGIWANRRADLLKDIIHYGDDHDWKMGEGDPSRTVMSPALVSTIYQMAKALGIKGLGGTLIPLPVDSNLKGFQAHLQALHIALRADMAEEISKTHLKVLEKTVENSPNNALFQAIFHRFSDGNQEKTIELLLSEDHFPNHRLPTSKEHCEFWLWQRDEDEDWEPCKPVVEFSGADFLFVAHYLMQ